MSRRVVGVLGGMGPEATILLQQRLLGSVEATDDADHLPLLIDMNPQVPSRIAHLIDGTGRDPTPVLTEMAQRLEAAGATALAMPCNTAHHYASSIQKAVSIPFLNMVELSVSNVAQTVKDGAAVGILASPAVMIAKVFDAALDRAGLSAIWPGNSDGLLATIRSIKAHGPTPGAEQVFAAAAEDVAERGAAVLIVACSEFSLIRDVLPGEIRSLDTVDVLVAAIREHMLNG